MREHREQKTDASAGRVGAAGEKRGLHGVRERPAGAMQ